jgi:hypothetical protein
MIEYFVIFVTKLAGHHQRAQRPRADRSVAPPCLPLPNAASAAASAISVVRVELLTHECARAFVCLDVAVVLSASMPAPVPGFCLLHTWSSAGRRQASARNLVRHRQLYAAMMPGSCASLAAPRISLPLARPRKPEWAGSFLLYPRDRCYLFLLI